MKFVRLAAALTAAVLVASGCSGSEPASDDRPAIDPVSAAKVAQLRELPFWDGNVKVLRDQLEAAGVGVTDDVSTPGAATVRLSGWQVQNMAAEAANGGGVRGDLLATIAKTPQGAPPIGYLVSAWALSYDSDAARFAHALLGERDFHHPERIVFPNAVLTLFLADATKATSTTTGTTTGTAPGTAAGNGPALAGAAKGPCTAVTNFVQRAIHSVANVLKVNASKGGFLGFLGKIWNAAVDLAAGLVQGLIETVTQPVVNLMADVFGVIATIEQVSTFLTVWRAKLAPQPEENRFGVDAEVVTGQVTLTVMDNRLPIPELILDCAEAFGVDLREVGSAAGSKIAWDPINQGRADLSSKKSADAELGKNQAATYTYATGQETAKLAAGGREQERAGLLQLTASVARNDVERVRRLFTKLLFDQIPASVRDIVETVGRPVLDLATRHLTALTDVKAVTYVGILYHAEKQPSPSTKKGGNGLGCGPNGVAPGRYQQTRNVKDMGDGVTDREVLDVTVAADGKVSGTISRITEGPDMRSEGGFTIGGTVSAPAYQKLILSMRMPGLKPVDKREDVGNLAAEGPMTGDCTKLIWEKLEPTEVVAQWPQAKGTDSLFWRWEVPRA